MEDSSNDIIKLQTALMKVQLELAMKTEAFNTECDLKETTDNLQALQHHHKVLLEQTVKLKQLHSFARSRRDSKRV